MNLRGKVVPVLDLEKKFGLTRDTQDARQHIMIAESAQKMLFGIVVDHVEEVLKISNDRIKPAPEAVKNNISAEYLGGVLILGGRQDQQAAQATASKERVLLILDLQKILSDADAAELRAAQAPQSTPTNAINEGGTV
jgi:purine-binding chemotaxis protein CheW